VAHRSDADHEAIINLRAPGTMSNPEIKAGDTITVGEAGIVYVLGEVGRPGGFLINHDERLTVMQALAMAEGVKPGAALKKARLIRASGQGRQEVAVDLKEVFSGRGDDLPLQDDDIVFVPGSTAKSALKRGMEAAIQVTTGLVIYGR
jgi:polysaccharide biosynthesis/export protein